MIYPYKLYGMSDGVADTGAALIPLNTISYYHFGVHLPIPGAEICMSLL